MSEIDKYNAPRGYVAVSPEESSLDGIGECTGCCFDSVDDSGCVLDMASSVMYSPCWAEGRDDHTDIIFKEFVEEDDE